MTGTVIMFYRKNKTFWHQFCNLDIFSDLQKIHFGSDDSLVSSCEKSVATQSDWFTIGTSPHLGSAIFD